MSYDAPNPGKPGYTLPHATTIQIDALTGHPVGHPSATPLQVEGSLSISAVSAASMQDNEAVTVGSTAMPLVAANPNRIELEFCNGGADPVAIGATGITWAKRCTPLEPGDSRIQGAGANLAWFAICATGKTASVTVREVLK